MSDSIERSELTRRVLLAGLWTFLTGVFWVMSFPGRYQAPSTGIDPSWEVGLNLFTQLGFRAGTDFVFTYGPLGYLVRPLDVGSHLFLALAVRVALHLSLLLVLVWVAWRTRSASSALLFLSGYALLLGFGRDFDYELLGLCLLFAAVALVHRAVALLAVASSLCAVLLFVKFSSGASALAQLAICFLLWRWRWGCWRGPLAACATFGFVLAVLASRLLGSFPGAIEFARGSARLAAGYSAAMVLSGPDGPAITALVTVVLSWSCIFLLLRKTDPDTVWVIALGSISVVYGFKYAFIRQDEGHVPLVFAVMFSVLLTALLVARSWRGRITLSALLCLQLVALRHVVTPARWAAHLGVLQDILSVRAGTRNVGHLFTLPRTRADLAQIATANLVPDLLPRQWLSLIGRSTVLVVPWEISICWANALNCLPVPTLQMYATYSAELDRWSAHRIQELRPEFVVASVDAIDQRNMLWDCPETWAQLLQGWELVARSDSDRLLLRRREIPDRWTAGPLLTTEARVGDWVELPPRVGPVRVALDLTPRLSGLLRNVLLRPRVVMLQTRGASGVIRAFRLVPDTARNGLLLDAIPSTASQLAGLFDCCGVTERVEALRITGPGARDLSPEMRLGWTMLTTTGGLRTQRVQRLLMPPLAPGEPLVALDYVDSVPVATATNPLLLVASDGGFTVSGWAVDREGGTAVSEVFLDLDNGDVLVPTEYGFPRPDVAAHFKEAGYASSGFRGTVTLDRLAVGRHQLRVRIVSRGGTHSQVSTRAIELEIR